MRLMVGASMWTKICNLQMECNISPLISRIQAKNAAITAKALFQAGTATFKRRVKEDLARHPDLPISPTWSASMAKGAKACNVDQELLQFKPAQPFEGYKPLPPWEPFLATFNYTSLPTNKSQCEPVTLQTAAKEAISKVVTLGCIQYYTDGSVDPDVKATGAAVYSEVFTGSWRTSNTCSTLQTELIAILKALEHSLQHQIVPHGITSSYQDAFS